VFQNSWNGKKSDNVPSENDFEYLSVFQDDERRSLLRKLTDEEYKDVIRVLASFPILDVIITTEVVDDEEQHVVTAGAIVTVTLLLERR
jgi:translocation protein SEC63